jgi:DNA gyrase subunit A
LLYFITLKGRAATAPVYALPEREDAADGTPFSSVSALDPNARVVAVVALSPEVARRAAEADAAAKANGANGEGSAHAGAYILLATANGMVKKTSAGDLPGSSSQVFNLINVAEEDSVVGARLTTGSDEILLITALGRAIRFREDEVRAMGLVAGGVMGIKPGERDDKVVGLDVAQPKAEIFMITDQGMGKRTPVKDYPTQGRYGVGVTAAGLAGKQRLAGFAVGQPGDRLTVLTSKGAKALKFEAAGRRGRPARGSTIVKLKAGETVLSLVPALAQFSLPEVEAPPEKPASKPSKASKPARNGKAGAKKAVAPKPKPGRAAKNGKRSAQRQ